MAVTVSGTSITFNDGTTQTTAAGAPTTAQVLNATAGASVGAVGTYAFLGETSATTTAPGATRAGSSLRYTTIATSATFSIIAGYGYPAYAVTSGTNAPSGTWRCMGWSQVGTYACVGLTPATLWLRIS